MDNLPPEDFARRVTDLGLSERRQVDVALSDLKSEQRTLEGVIAQLQRRGLVTTLQTEKILRGDRIGYFYGEYKVLYLIGVGTFARVYRASHDEKVVAVKVLRKRFRDEPAELEQFLREGSMGLKLRHPNIVSINEVVPDRRNPFLVMEFVEGQTLRELVRIRGALPVDLSLRLINEVAAGLAHAASVGISHRDLKLSNVLISSSGRAKLVDFGLAALSDRNNPDKIADCPNARAIDYAALERGSGVRKDDPRSDIYFAGNMLYHMLTGTPALTETRDRLARLNISRFQDIEPVTKHVEVPGLVSQLLNKMMEFNPEKRIQSASALVAESKRVIDALARGQTKREGENLPKVGEEYQDDDVASDEGEGYVVMLVETKATLQNAIRERLKARGYRVLIIQDPHRALARFQAGDDPPADCVIFSASELGSLALEAYNRFATDEHTAEMPAIMLADRRQARIIAEARGGPRRQMLSLPLRVRELRATLMKVLAGTERRPMGTY